MPSETQRPIGIFDSGIGGLTVARAISAILPLEQLVYFGDTAHLPYGDKSAELVQSYATDIAGYLLQHHRCKAIVIACNTASAAAYLQLRDQFKGQVPVINVIDPMIEAVISREQIHKVGIIGTRTTIGSGVYQEKFGRRKPRLKLATLASPLLADMIEDGFYNDRISNAVISKYLSHPTFHNLDALILACTHYPLIRNEISEFYDNTVEVFDSAQVVAAKLQVILENEYLLAKKRPGQNQFFVSDFTRSFEKTTRIFYGEEIHLKRI